MANKVVKYILESRDELKKVVWPNRKTTIKYTLLVLGVSFATGVFLGALDYGLNYAIEFIIK